MKSTKNNLSPKQRDDLPAALSARFDANQGRHPGLAWAKVQARLEARPDKLWSLAETERTGGEPDVVAHDKKSGEFVFFDCSEQSPAGRTNLHYDRQKLDVVNQTRSHPALRDWRSQFLPELKPLEIERFGNCGEFATIRRGPSADSLNPVEFDGIKPKP